MNLSDILSKIRGIVKTDSTENVLNKLNALSPYPNRNIISELISSTVGQLDNVVADSYGLSLSRQDLDRIQRYQLYRSIYRNIPFCKRAIKVIVANILSPDTISKKTIKIDFDYDQISEDEITSSHRAVLENCRILAKQIQLNKKARTILSRVLVDGDFFVQLIRLQHQPKKTVVSEGDVSILIESYNPANLSDNVIKESTAELLNDFPQVNNKQKQSDKQITEALSDVYIRFIDPERVISLTIEDVCFGYIVLPRAGYVNTLQFSEHQRIELAKKIIKSILPKLSPEEQAKFSDEIAAVLARIEFSKQMKAIFVPPTDMVHFKVESSQYYPYGESVFTGVELDAKILLLLKNALAIHRINSATDRRVVAIEIGLPRNAAQAIEKFKQVMQKRKVTLDSIGTLDAIPSMISTFETIYLPMKDGRRFIEFDRLESLTDVAAKTEELKTIRDSVISGTGVPPLFLGVDEIEKKATASHQNILFTRDIVDYQEMFTEQFNEFLRKLYKIVIPDKSDYAYLDVITVNFPPPKNLQIEMTAELVNSVTSMISSLKELGIPSDYLVKEFLSNLLNLEEIKEYKQKEEVTGEKGEETETTGPAF